MINNSEFILKEIPKLNPILDEYEYNEFWSEQIKRNIEGYWIAGKWMPGPLYDFANFHRGLVRSDFGNQEVGRLIVRDNDWEDFLYYEECRGFSGFELDEEYTCHRALIDPNEDDESIIRKFCWSHNSNKKIDLYYNNIFKPDGSRKKYVPAREYLRKIHKKSLGTPIYRNHSQNFISFQARQAGKTMRISSMVRTNFLYGGSNNWKDYLEKSSSGNFPVSQSIMAAEYTGYVSTLAMYVRLALDNLPGSIEYAGETFPSPMYLNYEGAKKVGDADGFTNIHNSKLQTRVLADNPLSTNSGRPNLVAIDEIGFVKNPDDVIGTLMGSQASQAVKTIVIWMIGTGGAVKGESVKYAEKLFYDPENYNALAFDDIWEHRSKTIGNFVPITHTSWDYKDAPNYITNVERGERIEKLERAKLKKNKKALESRMINSPLFPSECFLLGDNARFPTVLLKEQLAQLLFGNLQDKLDSSHKDGSKKGWMKFNGMEVVFEEDRNAKPIRDYPFNGDNDEMKGAVEIWYEPVKDDAGEIEYARYIGGIDPVDAESGTSLACIWIKDLKTQRLVAKYLGRTGEPSFFFEQCRRLLIFYNAKALYENNLTGIFVHFTQEKSLRYLAETPSHLKSKEDNNTGSGAYGYRNQGKMNDDGIDSILTWLQTPIDNYSDELGYSTIYDPELLLNMIKYVSKAENAKANWDSLSALIALTHYENSIYKIKKDNQVKLRDTATEYFKMRKKELGFVNLYNIKDDEDSTRAKITTN